MFTLCEATLCSNTTSGPRPSSRRPSWTTTFSRTSRPARFLLQPFFTPASFFLVLSLLQHRSSQSFLCSSIVYLSPFFAPASFFFVLSLLQPGSSYSLSFFQHRYSQSFLCLWFLSFRHPWLPLSIKQAILHSFLSSSRTVPLLSLAKYFITFLSFIGFLSSPPLFLLGISFLFSVSSFATSVPSTFCLPKQFSCSLLTFSCWIISYFLFFLYPFISLFLSLFQLDNSIQCRLLSYFLLQPGLFPVEHFGDLFLFSFLIIFPSVSFLLFLCIVDKLSDFSSKFLSRFFLRTFPVGSFQLGSCSF